MNIPTFPKQNFAMHLLGSCFVELFPNIQLLDLTVFPDRFCIDFSFSRSLSLEELEMLKKRFFQKVSSNQKGDIREMVSKNACDLLKHYKQIFLIDLVDSEEMFAEMLCMDLYNAPLFGEIDQDLASIKELHLEMNDLGEKKWMKRRVHHYQMECFVFHSKGDLKKAKELMILGDEIDHLEIGRRERLFWANDGAVSFSPKGEGLIQGLISEVVSIFGDLVYIEGDIVAFQELLEIDRFTTYLEEPGSYDGICYGLKDTEWSRLINAYDFSNKDIKEKIVSLSHKLKVNGKFDENGNFVAADYRGITWTLVKIIKDTKYLTAEIDLLCFLALKIENNFK